jgi:hypothetical protein
VSLSSLGGDGTADGAVESCSQWFFRCDIGHGAMLLSSHAGDVGCGVMSLSSHAADGHGTMSLLSLAVDGTVEAMLVMALLR